MEHLDFVNKLNELGVSIRSTNIENKEKEHYEPGIFGEGRKIIIKNLKATYEDDGLPALNSLIKSAIDIETWKHSWHNEITPENYDKFIEIIQDSILNRAKQIDFLLTTLFLINKAKSDN
jgi:hypothetical protein